MHRVNAISRHDWLVARLVGWLAETGYAAANPNERAEGLPGEKLVNWNRSCATAELDLDDDVGSPGQLERYADPRCT